MQPLSSMNSVDVNLEVKMPVVLICSPKVIWITDVSLGGEFRRSTILHYKFSSKCRLEAVGVDTLADIQYEVSHNCWSGEAVTRFTASDWIRVYRSVSDPRYSATGSGLRLGLEVRVRIRLFRARYGLATICSSEIIATAIQTRAAHHMCQKPKKGYVPRLDAVRCSQGPM